LKKPEATHLILKKQPVFSKERYTRFILRKMNNLFARCSYLYYKFKIIRILLNFIVATIVTKGFVNDRLNNVYIDVSLCKKL